MVAVLTVGVEGRADCMDERGVWAGEVAAEAVLFLLKVKKGMAMFRIFRLFLTRAGFVNDVVAVDG